MTTSGIPESELKKIERLKDAVRNPSFFAGWAKRRLPELYANAQRQRWQSQGSSEGHPWRALNYKYEGYKKRKFRTYPGGGQKMMIATGRLFSGLMPPKYQLVQGLKTGNEFRNVVETKSVRYSTTVPYARFADADRAIAGFSADTMRLIAADFKKYVVKTLKQAIKKGSKS